MLDHNTSKQAEALAVRLLTIKAELRQAGDDEGVLVAASVIHALCDVIDLGWLRERRNQLIT